MLRGPNYTIDKPVKHRAVISRCQVCRRQEPRIHKIIKDAPHYMTYSEAYLSAVLLADFTGVKFLPR